MRLAAKLILLFLVGLLLVVALFSFLTIQQERQIAIAEHERHAADLAATLQPSIQRAMRDREEFRLPELVSQSTRQVRHVRVRWVEYSSNADRSREPSVPAEMIVRQREITTISMPNASGQNTLYTFVPVEADSSEGGHRGIEVSAPDVAANDRLRSSLVSSLLALLGVATLSGAVIVIGGVRMVAKPLNRLIEKVHRVGNGDFSNPVEVTSRDELGRLGVALNDMCEQLADQRQRIESETASRIATVEQLRHAERLNMVGRMAAGIAHEIGTPLNVVTGRAELIASGSLSPEANRESAQAIQSEAQRISKIIRDLLDFARQATPNRSRQNLCELVESTVALVRPLIAKSDCELNLSTPDGPCIANVDPAQIQQVLTNLIVNAAQSTPGHGEIDVALSESVVAEKPDETPSPHLRITVKDNGVGIAEDQKEKIFEPFYTTKDVGEGTGLGLSLSHGIVQEHEGWIELNSELGKGSEFVIYLPVDAASQEKKL